MQDAGRLLAVRGHARPSAASDDVAAANKLGVAASSTSAASGAAARKPSSSALRRSRSSLSGVRPSSGGICESRDSIVMPEAGRAGRAAQTLVSGDRYTTEAEAVVRRRCATSAGATTMNRPAL